MTGRPAKGLFAQVGARSSGASYIFECARAAKSLVNCARTHLSIGFAHWPKYSNGHKCRAGARDKATHCGGGGGGLFRRGRSNRMIIDCARAAGQLRSPPAAPTHFVFIFARRGKISPPPPKWPLRPNRIPVRPSDAIILAELSPGHSDKCLRRQLGARFT